MLRRISVSLREKCIKFSQSDTILGDMCHSGYVAKSHWHTQSDTFLVSDTNFQRQKMCHIGHVYCIKNIKLGREWWGQLLNQSSVSFQRLVCSWKLKNSFLLFIHTFASVNCNFRRSVQKAKNISYIVVHLISIKIFLSCKLWLIKVISVWRNFQSLCCKISHDRFNSGYFFNQIHENIKIW